MNKRLESVIPHLVCPICRGPLSRDELAFSCPACVVSYPIRRGKIYFKDEVNRDDSLDFLKGSLKKALGRWYYDVGVNVFSPDYPMPLSSEVRKLCQVGEGLIVYAGCGNHRFRDDVIGIDFLDYDAVDIVCDVMNLPFREESVDLVCTRSLLEHIEHPLEVVHQFLTVTKTGGFGVHMAPFLYHFHASPQDFGRYTHKGLQSLFGRWSSFYVTNVSGPFTLFVSLSVEVLARLFSLGSHAAYAVLYLVFCLGLFPIKFLDVFCIRRETFMSVAPMFLVVVRK